MPMVVNTEVLARLVRLQTEHYANLRDAADAAKVSPATLSRVQRGHAPDMDALTALARWLQVPVEKLLHNPPVVDRPREGTSTVEKVQVHLRADPHLSAETASRLGEIFEVLYEEFAAHDRQSPRRQE